MKIYKLNDESKKELYPLFMAASVIEVSESPVGSCQTKKGEVSTFDLFIDGHIHAGQITEGLYNWLLNKGILEREGA